MIDVHAHHWPEGLLAAVRTGGSWYGWEPVRLNEGRTVVARGDRLVRFEPPSRDLVDLDERIVRRERNEGVVAELTMPVGFLWGEDLGESRAASYCRELNEEMAAAQAQRPDRYRGAAMLPFHAPRRFEAELAIAVELGLTAVAVPSNVRGMNLDDHTALPLVEAVVDAGLAMMLHPTYLTPVGADRFPRYYFNNSFGAPLEAALALMSLVYAGLFDRRPEARVLAVNGAGCLPYEVGRFAGRYRERADARPMAASPETYLPAAYYDCLVLDDRSLHLLVDRVGSDRVMVGTDHPFHTDVPGGAVKWLKSREWLTESQLDDILFGTALNFLQWEGPRPPVPAQPGLTEES
jgi:aminocarboxymuconate-semialdehyde decarboxylase